MIEVRSTFTPFKMKNSRREPVVLSVEIRNAGNEPEIVSLDLNLGGAFSLERSGFKNTATEKIPEFKPGESKKYYYDLFAKQAARAGEYGMKLTVTEHYKGFNYVKRKHDKTLRLVVED